ncbi:ef-hand calcium-binding [Lynx pardinus]|uniref:Ef-hand calcium-binding n=1 Tax=Lynx pardinus TaxID=191816 RepID=A0A485NBT6_LYNPA|nr:ef-hand calcium-binding [Lynx pardinus]
MNRKKLQKLTDTLTKNCKHFNKFEVQCLINLFYNLVGDVTERQGVVTGLDRNAFRNILHMTFGMTDDMIMDRVFRGFDKDNDGCVNVSEWISGLSVFLRGTLEEKMKYYEQAVREETLLLEAFGPCLPDPKSEMEFEAQVFKDPNEFNDI